MDITLTKPISPHGFLSSVNRQLPPGIQLLEAFVIPPTTPSLQSQVSAAQYQIEVVTQKLKEEIENDIQILLALEHLEWHHERDTGRRNYDLRRLIEDVWVMDCSAGVCTLGMELRCDESGSGRPEQVAAALGFTERPQAIHRTKLTLNANR
jgi:radical SAM-linked protein